MYGGKDMDIEICMKACGERTNQCVFEPCFYGRPKRRECCFECLLLGEASPSCQENHQGGTEYFKFILLYKKKVKNGTYRDM